MELISRNKCFGGVQSIYSHYSTNCKTYMRFSIFTPPGAEAGAEPFPTLYWLSGLTCTEENFIIKSGVQRVAAELGLIIVGPDTSPRGENIPDDPQNAYDFGQGAGFYIDATEEPWVKNYRMYSYVAHELPSFVGAAFPVDCNRTGIFGHSMGGHGALTIALKNPDRFQSVSAFAPIVSPMQCGWGEKALSLYLGEDREGWRSYDSCALIADGARASKILLDQGEADDFLEEQLKPELLETVCAEHDIPLTLRRHAGYDHSYYFIMSFIEDHLKWHLACLDD